MMTAPGVCTIFQGSSRASIIAGTPRGRHRSEGLPFPFAARRAS
jgi:hypothetical protein